MTTGLVLNPTKVLKFRTSRFGTPVGKRSVRLIRPTFLPIRTRGWASPLGKNSVRLVRPSNDRMMRLPIEPAMTPLSGSVKNSNGDPLERELRIYNGERNLTQIGALRTFPDGSFSMNVNGNHNNIFTVMANGEAGENSPLHTKITGKVSTYGHYLTISPIISGTYFRQTSVNPIYSSSSYGVAKTSAHTLDTTNESWVTSETPLPQKINIDYVDPFLMGRILIDNFIDFNWWNTNLGIKEFEVYGTNSSTAFNNTTGTDLTDLTLLGSFEAVRRDYSPINKFNFQAFILTNNSIPYRYAVIRVTSRFPNAPCCGVRRIHMQRYVG